MKIEELEDGVSINNAINNLLDKITVEHRRKLIVLEQENTQLKNAIKESMTHQQVLVNELQELITLLEK